ncbi:hypothetical protein [Aneurinibacillus migulanus]|uniref:hypothetical protein n=1 Tax=Aneurinibacillus migulanus TaxID=47500 RepID=UPI001F477B2A|nr:hypothetical protein [Aneurinibacillus migulanus]
MTIYISFDKSINSCGKREEKKGGGRERSEKDTLAYLLPDSRAHPTSSFSESPPSNHTTLSNYQV